ncbi:MAG: class I SAM-dependent methyltransferase [Clostridia bacterium]|nr:class I SAM-dependent methyltransferase [Clostridia bacterium]
MSEYNAFAEVYDRLTGNIEYSKRAEFIRTLLTRYGIADDAIVLDLACGTGSLTVELAKYGYDMIGVDSSPMMLSQAQEKMYDNELSMLFLCQDMTELDLYGTIDAAVCTLDSLNHLEKPDDIRDTIDKVGLFMNHGGIFVFDVNTIYKHREILGNNTFVYDCDDVYCVWQNQLCDDDSVEISLDIFEYDDGAYFRESESFKEIACPIDMYKKWLCDAEFGIIDIYDEMTSNKLCDTTQRAVFVARYNGKAED